MSLFFIVFLLCVVILLGNKRLTTKVAIFFISITSQQNFSFINIGIGIALIAFSFIQPYWYFYSMPLSLFVFGLIILTHGIYIFRAEEQAYIEFVKKIHKNYFKCSIPLMVIFTTISMTVLFRSYLGPLGDLRACSSGNNLNIVCGFKKPPEDIAITPDNNYILISGFGGIAPLQDSELPETGLIMIMDPYTKTKQPINISFGENIWGDGICSRDPEAEFNPHGIDLVKRDDGKFQFGVINHWPDETIEMFELVEKDSNQENNEGSELFPWELVWRGCVRVPDTNYLNDLSLATDGSLFATHMYPRDITLSEFLLKSITRGDTGYVLRWDNLIGFSEVAESRGGQPNGVFYEQELEILHVVLNLSDKIVAIDLQTNQIINSLSLDSPDNLVFDGENLWVTNLEHSILDPLICDKTACPLPFKVSKINPQNYKVIQSWIFAGEPFGLPSVAIPISNEMISGEIFVGSFRSDRLAYFNADFK